MGAPFQPTLLADKPRPTQVEFRVASDEKSGKLKAVEVTGCVRPTPADLSLQQDLLTDLVCDVPGPMAHMFRVRLETCASTNTLIGKLVGGKIRSMPVAIRSLTWDSRTPIRVPRSAWSHTCHQHVPVMISVVAISDPLCCTTHK